MEAELDITVENGLDHEIAVKKKKMKVSPEQKVIITPPNFAVVVIPISGTAPYCQHKFSQKSRKQMEATQRAGKQAGSRKERKPREFEEDYERAQYVTAEGWHGMPAAAFRKSMISACRAVGFKMTIAKMSIFVVADGHDKEDGTPLVRLAGKPHQEIHPARNDNGGMDLRARAFFDTWTAKVRVRFDQDCFSAEDIVNLMARAGVHVGIGDGRPDSPNSAGMDWGTWEIVRGQS